MGKFQSVSIENFNFSQWKITVNHGFPQGTVLESFIFLLYVNDFFLKNISEIDIVQFADDNNIIC